MKTVYLRSGRWGRIAQLTALGAGCLALAACAGNVTNGNRTAARSGGTATATVESPHAVMRAASRPRRTRTTVVTRTRRTAAIRATPAKPRHRRAGYSTVGTASWYGPAFNGRRTANGETFNMNALTAAHPTLPIPCTVRVTNLSNRRSVTVRVNDRGPFVGNRVIDVSAKAARTLGFYDRGLAKVKIDYIGPAPRREATALPSD